MVKTVDISPEEVTRRMKRLDELWELTVALRTADIKSARPAEAKPTVDNDTTSTPADCGSSRKSD